MKRFLIILGLSFIVHDAHSQQCSSSFSISVDGNSGSPIEGALVEIIRGGIVISSQSTQSDGRTEFTITGVATENVGAPNSLKLGAPYPQPATETAVIPMQVRESGDYRVFVFDVLGRQVINDSHFLSAGDSELSLSLRGLSKGTYFVNVAGANGQSSSRSFVLASESSGSPSLDVRTISTFNDEPVVQKGGSSCLYVVRISKVGYRTISSYIDLELSFDKSFILELFGTPSDETVVVDSTQLDLGTITDNTMTFTVGSGAPTVEMGDILAGVQGEAGYLRKVTGTSMSGNQLTVTTEQVSIAEAVVDGSLTNTVGFGTGKRGGGWEVTYEADGVGACSDNSAVLCLDEMTIFEGKASGGGANADIRVFIPTGGITFEPDILIDATWNNNAIDYFSTSATGSLGFNLDLTVEASAGFQHSEELEIFSAKHVSVQFIGPVPVYEVITLSFVAGFEIEAGAQVNATVGFDASASVTVGAEYRDGSWSDIYTRNTTFNEHPLQWDASAQAMIRGYVRPRVDVKLYDVAGPYLYIEPYLRMDGAVNQSQWNSALTGGLDAFLGFEVAILDHQLVDYSTQLVGFEARIAEDSGENGGGDFSETTNSIGLEMIRIPAGTFRMGSEALTRYAPEVTLTHNFWLGKYEVTQEEYGAVTGVTFHNPNVPGGPVTRVSAIDAIRFANALSILEGLDPCYDVSPGATNPGDIYSCNGYRLPTEAEWEYAARAGTTTDYFFGDDINLLADYAWLGESGGRKHVVGSKKPNPWGFYDMSGNAFEWVHDYQRGSLFGSDSALVDPQGLTDIEVGIGKDRMIRGGSFRSASHYSPIRRQSYNDLLRGDDIGFRLARTAQ